ncbi:MAG: hypothetical protein MHMPM18_002410 [Marteilia pararefringens]
MTSLNEEQTEDLLLLLRELTRNPFLKYDSKEFLLSSSMLLQNVNKIHSEESKNRILLYARKAFTKNIWLDVKRCIDDISQCKNLQRPNTILKFLHDSSIFFEQNIYPLNLQAHRYPSSCLRENTANSNFLSFANTTSGIHSLGATKTATESATKSLKSKNGSISSPEDNRSIANRPPEAIITLWSDIFCILQGRKSQSIEFNEYNQEFFCSISSVNPNVLNTMCEIGLVVAQINSFIDQSYSKYANSLILKSLIFAIKLEMKSFYKILSCYQSNIKTLSKDEIINISDYYLQFAEEIVKLKHICLLIGKMKNKSGSAIISNLYSLLGVTGDKDMRNLIKRFANIVLVPYMHIILKWSINGDLCEDSDDFFVSRNFDELATKETWKKYFLPIYDNVPVFIDAELALKIYKSGKCVNLMKSMIKLNRFRPFSEKSIKAIIEDHSSAFFDNDRRNEIIGMIDSIFKYNNDALVNSLISSYNLKIIFHIHRDIILSKRSLFNKSFIQKLNEIKASEDLNIVENLVYCMKNTISSYNTIFPFEILSCLDIIIKDTDSKTIDNFYMIFNTNTILRNIFTESNQTKYGLIYKEVLKAYIAEDCLMKMYSPYSRQRIDSYKGGDNLTLVYAHKIISKLIHFCQTLISHYQCLAIELPWIEFMQKIENINDFDDLLKGHIKFLNQTLENMFITKNNKIRDCIHEIFKIVNEIKKELIVNTGDRKAINDSLSQHLIVVDSNLDKIMKKLITALLTSNNNNLLKQFAIQIDFNDYFNQTDNYLRRKSVFYAS